MTAADRIPGLVAAGLTDPEVAAALGVHPDYAQKLRRRLGLPPNRVADTPAGRERRRAVLARTRERHGGRLAPPHDAHRPRREAVARRYNLPPDLPLTQVRVLLALAGGPLPVAELAARVKPTRAGAPPYKRFAQGKVAGKNHLAALCRRGLVGRLRGRSSCTYFLTLTALGLLTRTESPR